MDRMQKQTILVMLGSIEQQISSLRGLVMLGDEAETSIKIRKQKTAAAGYTNEEEDAELDKILKVDAIDEEEQAIQRFAAKSQEGNPLDG